MKQMDNLSIAYQEAKMACRYFTVRLLYFDETTINNQPKLLLLKRAHHQRLADQLEPPGGQLNDQENPLEGILRETREETGIELTTAHLRFIGYLDFVTSQGKPIRELFFLASAPAYSIKICSEEHSDFIWAPLNHLADYPLHPAILQFLKENMTWIQALLTTCNH